MSQEHQNDSLSEDELTLLKRYRAGNLSPDERRRVRKQLRASEQWRKANSTLNWERLMKSPTLLAPRTEELKERIRAAFGEPNEGAVLSFEEQQASEVGQIGEPEKDSLQPDELAKAANLWVEHALSFEGQAATHFALPTHFVRARSSVLQLQPQDQFTFEVTLPQGCPSSYVTILLEQEGLPVDWIYPAKRDDIEELEEDEMVELPWLVTETPGAKRFRVLFSREPLVSIDSLPEEGSEVVLPLRHQLPAKIDWSLVIGQVTSSWEVKAKT